MRFILTFILMVITCQTIFSQGMSILSVEYNRYYNHPEIYQRKNGFSIAYEYEWKLKDYLHLNLGMKAKGIQEIYKYNTLSYDTYTDPITGETDFTNMEVYEENADGFVIGIQIPFYVKTSLYNSKLFLLTGMNIGIEDLFTFTEYAGTDPEVSSMDTGNQYPKKRAVGFGYNVGLLYELTSQIGLFGEFTSTQNSNITYNYVSLGLKIYVGGKKNK